MTEPQKPDSAYPRENPKHWIGVVAEDIPQGWMDDMVKRLFEILNRNMIRLEREQSRQSDKLGPDGKPEPLEMEQFTKNVRLAKDMQNSLERLRELEDHCAKARRPKRKAMSDAQVFAELERRIDQLVADEPAPEDPGKSRS